MYEAPVLGGTNDTTKNIYAPVSSSRRRMEADAGKSSVVLFI